MIKSTWLDELFISIDKMDTTKFVSFITDDGVLTFANAPAMKGKDEIFQGIEGFFKSIKELKHFNLEVFDIGENIVTRGDVFYRRHDDTTLTVGFCNVFKMKNGLIEDYRIYSDISQLYNQYHSNHI